MDSKKKYSTFSRNSKIENNKTGEQDLREFTDIDSMLKNHLKASVNKEGLEVSEELVQKTLAKINQLAGRSEENMNLTMSKSEEIITQNKNKSDKNLSYAKSRSEENIVQTERDLIENRDSIVTIFRGRNRTVRRLASAAAAIILLIVSVTVWKERLLYSNDEVKLEMSQSTESGQNPENDLDNNMDSGDGNSVDGNRIADSIIEDSMIEDELDIAAKNTNESEYAQDSIGESVEESADSSLPSKEDGNSMYITSPAVFSINYYIHSFEAEVTAFTVTREGEEGIFVTDKAGKVKELYSILDQYEMTVIDNGQSENLAYTADIQLTDGREVVIYIWDTGNISVVTKSSEMISYALDDGGVLLEEIKEFYNPVIEKE